MHVYIYICVYVCHYYLTCGLFMNFMQKQFTLLCPGIYERDYRDLSILIYIRTSYHASPCLASISDT